MKFRLTKMERIGLAAVIIGAPIVAQKAVQKAGVMRQQIIQKANERSGGIDPYILRRPLPPRHKPILKIA